MAVTVLIINYFQLFTGGDQSVALGGVLVCEKGLRCKAVFHIRESRQDALAVGGDHFVVGGLSEAQTSTELSALKERQRHRRPHGPQTARPIEQRAGIETLET